MGFDIPMKTTGAYNKDSIINRFGNQNAISKNNFVQNNKNNTSSSQRPSHSGNGIKLQRGQKIKLSDGVSNTNLKFYFRWDIKNPECELDGSSFMLDGRNKVISDDWFIFYGNPQSPDKSLNYRPYEEGNGAEISINISTLNPNVQKIVMSVTIYEAFERNLNFGMIENVSVSIADSSKNTEIAHFDIDDCYSSITALVVGELYRYKNEWKFNAVGSGVQRDLAGFCGMYGVNLI